MLAQVEQSDDGISLQLDTYAQELIEEYRLIHKKFIKPRTVPMSLGLVLDNLDCPELPDPVKQNLLQKQFRSTLFKVSWQHTVTGSGSIYRTRLHNWHDSVHQQGHLIGQHLHT